jgi:hypothetical protein
MHSRNLGWQVKSTETDNIWQEWKTLFKQQQQSPKKYGRFGNNVVGI